MRLSLQVPLLRIEGPLPIVQLLETTLLTLVNYARCAAMATTATSCKTYLNSTDSKSCFF